MLETIKLIAPVILMLSGAGILYLKQFDPFRQKHKYASIDLAVCLFMLGIMLETMFVIQHFIG